MKSFENADAEFEKLADMSNNEYVSSEDRNIIHRSLLRHISVCFLKW